MAQRPKQECKRCKELTDGGPLCTKHIEEEKQQRREYDRLRSSDPFKRLYKTARWLAVRLIVLARDPLCKDERQCEERALSTVVDHIIAAREWVANGGDFYDESNLRGCCKECHDAKRDAGYGSI